VRLRNVFQEFRCIQLLFLLTYRLCLQQNQILHLTVASIKWNINEWMNSLLFNGRPFSKLLNSASIGVRTSFLNNSICSFTCSLQLKLFTNWLILLVIYVVDWGKLIIATRVTAGDVKFVRSAVSKINRMLGTLLMRLPLLSVSIWLSSKTVFIDSNQTGSIGPSRTTHLWMYPSISWRYLVIVSVSTNVNFLLNFLNKCPNTPSFHCSRTYDP